MFNTAMPPTVFKYPSSVPECQSSTVGVKQLFSIRLTIFTHALNIIKKTSYTTLVRPLLEYSSSAGDPHTKTLVNQIAMVQRHASRFCHNDYKTIQKGCVSEMIGKLNLESQKKRRPNRRLTINWHAALPIGNLQPVLRRTRHLNSKAYNTINTSKDCYKHSFFPGQ